MMIALRTKIIVCSCILIVLYFFVGYSAFHKKTGIGENVISCMVYPFLRIQQGVVSTFSDYKKYWASHATLLQNLQELQEENRTLLAQIVQAQALQHYKETTQELISFKQRYEVRKSLLAHVILKQFSDNEHSLLVDRGSLHGCEIDMVAVYKNCLLGRVECVYPLYSKIRLITDKGCKVAAYCRASKARGIHEGCNGAYSSLQFVSHLSQITPHDILISSGEGLLFPQGFGIGRIASFQPDGLYYAITVKPLLKFEELEYCYLIKKGQESL
jgi:rod shape-determining protein MreC